MSDIEQTFSSRYMQKRTYIAWRKDLICDAIYNELKPKSLIDVGCSIGELVQGFKERGVDVKGLDDSTKIMEYLECDLSDVIFDDLSDHIRLDRSFDVATCFEVFGILPQEHREQAALNLCSFSDTILVACEKVYMDEVREYMDDNLFIEYPVMAVKIKQNIPEKWRQKEAIKKIYNGLACFGNMLP